ncbi:uncharacterized protein BDZ99DRAFT_448913 [Mytilinidion resinicola]|uniref:Uncharacterized protein n=1 Tax=Mytilinidion resinicola TaxID=574789 RepID=A0A6A6YBL6_9PEZI|nr:uncharacterized protein BDZ99DRAFT_448913 [Mytilinidion resinicola]KAF2806202.1 hypothetical protein BDZ99DRAFT_448913 [Mytilinidion resinicola]
MSESDPRRPLFTSDASDLSDLSHALNQVGGSSPVSPIANPRQRPGYTRLRSNTGGFDGSPILHEEDEDEDSGRERGGAGLGIETPLSSSASNTETVRSPALSARRVSIQAIPRVPVGSIRRPSVGNAGLSPNLTSPPMSSDPLTGGFPKYDSVGSTPDLRRERESPQDDSGDYQEYRRSAMRGGRKSEATVRSEYDSTPYVHSHDTERLRRSIAPSIRSAYETNDFHPQHSCPTNRDFYTSRFTWLSVTILILCLFSTIWSGVFLGIALKGPRYGRTITTHSKLNPYSAIILTAVMAKLIELSFVTSFVAFLGQVLSRRAFMKEQGRGITLAEMSMWRWVVQPGTLITHWHGVRYAGLSFLGLLSLLAAVLATLYTPAASALVQPQLHFGDWHNTILAGQVKASFGNPTYVASLCDTPISQGMDPLYAGSTCLQIEHASQGYHNYQRFMSYWTAISRAGNGSSDLAERPNGFGLLFDNTSITASWVEKVSVEDSSKKFGGRIVNNVSLAMPHASIFQAARDERNGIIQPDELDGQGIYSIRASIPSPVLNVLCVNMNRTDLNPIVYETWPNAIKPVNGSWATIVNDTDKQTNNRTVVDDLFGWNSSALNGHPPVFAKYPLEYNTIMNHTFYPYGRDTVYLLGAGVSGDFVLCQMRATMTPSCSTRYNATGSGGTMEALCEEKDDKLAYIRSLPNATYGDKQTDWVNIAGEWANSVSLNAGISDGNASNARLLTQLMLAEPVLNKALPSPAEALAVMGGCTLLMSSQDTPFVEFWNYTSPGNILGTPQTQYFNASIRAQEYASGANSSSSRGFLLVLIAVFLINVFVLIYFLFHKGLVTDFSEPPNLFALAVNSPPSKDLAGSCGGGPEGKQYQVNWFVNTEGDHLYMEPGEKSIDPQDMRREAGSTGFSFGLGKKLGKGMSPLLGGFGKKKGGMRPASVLGPELELEPTTPAAAMYAKLAKRRSML